MATPLEIEYRNIEPTELLESRVRQELAELEKYYNRLLTCRVEIQAPEHLRRGSASDIKVRIDLGLPAEDVPPPDLRELSVKPKSEHMEVTAEHKDPEMAVHAAFNDAHRRLKDVLIAREFLWS